MIDLESEIRSLHEEACDEIARLDESCAFVPASIPRALWLLAVAQLASADPAVLDVLVAAEGDTLHDAILPQAAVDWRSALDAEERRTRGGAFLSVSRLEGLVPTLASYAERERLEAIWRERGRERPVLIRALDSAAWFPAGEEGAANPGEAVAALLLCAGGRTDRVRLLPFSDVVAGERVRMVEAWRSGDSEPWARAALAAAAHRARLLREAVRGAAAGAEREDDAVAAMGRAGITARRALTAARRLLSVTMPLLAEDLELSRPAVAAALDRLAEAGLLREVTGRARDRVYAYEAAMAVAETARAS